MGTRREERRKERREKDRREKERRRGEKREGEKAIRLAGISGNHERREERREKRREKIMDLGVCVWWGVIPQRPGKGMCTHPALCPSTGESCVLFAPT